MDVLDDDMKDFMNEMDAGMDDMMDIMKQTQDELADDKPSLFAQQTVNIKNMKQPTLNNIHSTNSVHDVKPVINENGINDVFLNIGIPKGNGHHMNGIMDDDFDDHVIEIEKEYDPKDDLTPADQKNDKNVKFARNLAAQIDTVIDDVANADPMEQQYRMTHNPEDPKNIFVLKFGKDEEQHWRLPYNPTTNLLCHMEPNKLMIEQSKANALYMQYSMTPSQYKQQYMQQKRQKAHLQKERSKKYKIHAPQTSADNPRQQTPKAAHQNMNRLNTTTLHLGMADSANSSLLNVMPTDIKHRGTFQVNSMLVHSEQTVENAAMTDQERLIANQKPLLLTPQTSENQNVGHHMPQITPVTAQIAPELMEMNRNRNKNMEEDEIEPLKPNKPPKHQRRVSLASVDEYHTDDESDHSDDDSDDEENKKQKLTISNKGPLSLHIRDATTDTVALYDDAKGDFVELNPLQFATTAIDTIDENDEDVEVYKPPNVSWQSWHAMDVWKGILYLGDEWDAFNYLELMDHGIQYFINCAAGYCAFEFEQKIKRFWLEHWKEDRQRKKLLRKERQRRERQRKRDNRLEAFKRSHPEWAKRKGYTEDDNVRQSHRQSEVLDPNDVDGNDDDEKEKEAPPDLNEVGIDEFAKFVSSESPTLLNQSGSHSNKFSEKKKNEIKLEYGVGITDDAILSEIELFKERPEFEILKALQIELMELEIDDSDHSSMYDSCWSSEEYGYDSDDFDEFVGMSDDEIIAALCPFKFLNVYAHNWEGYRILDKHMNDVWGFIESLRMKNMELQQQWRQKRDNDDDISDIDRNDYGSSSSDYDDLEDEFDNDKPPKIACLIFCSKSNIAMSRLNREIAHDQVVDRDAVGRSICSLLNTYKIQQGEQEEIAWNAQMGVYEKYLDAVNEEMEQNGKNQNMHDIKAKIKSEIVKAELTKTCKENEKQRIDYPFWEEGTDEKFWEEYEEGLRTRTNAMNRLFASSFDRSAALVLGFMIHSGIRLKQSYKALLANRPNILRNQSFIRQLIQLDWMKHCFEKPGMREQIPFRDEYESYNLEKYLATKKHYDLR